MECSVPLVAVVLAWGVDGMICVFAVGNEAVRYYKILATHGLYHLLFVVVCNGF